MPSAKLDISVFFPVYNEGETIERVVRRAVDTLSRVAGRWEVVIVDDGSRDNTAEVAARLASEIAGVRSIRHAENRGYGGAVRSGLKAAALPWIFFTDGDGQFDPAEIELLVPFAEEADFVAGFRVHRRDHFLRALNAFCWGLLAGSLFGLRGKVRDINCAFKLFRRRVADEFDFRATGAMISTELLVRSKQLSYRFREVGVHHYPRTAGTPTGANPKVIIRAFVELFRLYRQLKSK
jgi:glycosyltransferase involved in cell wall biosynthesis